MDLVRVNLEEAIQAVQIVNQLRRLEWDQVQWYSNGEPVDIIDLTDPQTKMPPFDLRIPVYLECGNFIITPKSEAELTDE